MEAARLDKGGSKRLMPTEPVKAQRLMVLACAGLPHGWPACDKIW